MGRAKIASSPQDAPLMLVVLGAVQALAVSVVTLCRLPAASLAKPSNRIPQKAELD
jgi:hypothetical protein